MRNLLTLLALVLILACSTEAQQATAAGGQEVAARVGDRAITTRELDEHWKETAPAQRAQAEQAIYDGRRDALEDLVADMLITQAAKAKGQSAAQYTEAEVARRVKPVTDSEVATFYEANKGQMQGRTLEAMAALIRPYLEDQQRAAAHTALVAELRKGGPAVRVLFEPPRQQVTLAADDPSQGRADAPVTIVEFSDFQCPFCQRVAPTLKQVRATYGDRVRIVWKDFPLTQIHPQAFSAASAGNCAGEQGKFWEFHDQLFGNQQALQPEFLKKYAVAAGLDATKFDTCVDSAKYDPRVKEALAAGSRLGVSSTPTMFINGRLLSGAQPYEVFASVIDEELERAKK